MSTSHDQAPSVAQSTKEVLGVEEKQEDRDELTSTDFSNAAANLQASVSDAAGAVKEKVLPTAKAAGPDPDAQEAKEDAKGALQQAADSVKSGAAYISNRFTAPASGDKETDQEAKDKVKDKADQAADKADHAASKADKKTDEAGQSIGDAAKEAKDSVANSASYIANRFTAPASGDKETDQKGKEKAEDAKDKSAGFLSGILPKSNDAHESSSKSGGKSLGDKAHDKYESAKADVNKTQDSIAEQITPHTNEEAALSSGYIPSNTADQK